MDFQDFKPNFHDQTLCEVSVDEYSLSEANEWDNSLIKRINMYINVYYFNQTA